MPLAKIDSLITHSSTYVYVPRCINTPKVTTLLLAGISLYQQLLWERSQWDLERKQLLGIIKDQA